MCRNYAPPQNENNFKANYDRERVCLKEHIQWSLQSFICSKMGERYSWRKKKGWEKLIPEKTWTKTCHLAIKWDFFRSDFCTFLLARPKFTEILSDDHKTEMILALNHLLNYLLIIILWNFMSDDMFSNNVPRKWHLC